MFRFRAARSPISLRALPRFSRSQRSCDRMTCSSTSALGSGALSCSFTCSPERARGIEIQEPLVRIARERASALKLDVTFEHANVLDADLDGTVFFLYAPFNGDTLERVMGRLEHARVVWRKETID